MRVDWLPYAELAAVWGTVLYLHRAAREHAGREDTEGARARRWLLRTFIVGGTVWIVALPPGRDLLGALFGVADIGWFFCLCLSVISGYTLQRYWAAQAGRIDEGRRATIGSAWFAATALASLTTALLVILHTTPPGLPGDRMPNLGLGPQRGRDTPGALALTLIFSAYMGLAAFRCLHLARAAARVLATPALPDDDRRRLRRRARLYDAGWILAVGANIAAALTALAQYAHAPARWETAGIALTNGLLAGCQAALLSPSLFILAGRVREDARTWRDFRRLRPLLDLVQPERAAGLPPVVAGDALYQRIIAIRNEIATLEHYRGTATPAPAQTAHRGRGPNDEGARARAEAANLRAAAAARRAGATPRPPARPLPTPPDPSFAGELRYLLALAAALRETPAGTAAVTPPAPGAAGTGGRARRGGRGAARRRRAPTAARSRP